jgi:hypothetical protein
MRECIKGEALSKEPKIASAPWSELEARLDPYIERAKRLRDMMYGLSIIGMVLVLGGLLAQSPLVFYAFALVVLPRVVFAAWNAKNNIACPGCDAPLGFDWRGSPKVTRAVYSDHACPDCGIPFTQESA